MVMNKREQEEMADLRRQRDEAVKQMNDMIDNQTPSEFYSIEVACTESPPKIFKQYIQASSVTLEVDGL